jgi:hypothetical protein
MSLEEDNNFFVFFMQCMNTHKGDCKQTAWNEKDQVWGSKKGNGLNREKPSDSILVLE